MSLERAIATLEAEVAGFKQGTPDQPREGTEGWYVLRAKSLGLSLLKRMRKIGSMSAREEEDLFRCAANAAKLQERAVDESGSGAQAPG